MEKTKKEATIKEEFIIQAANENMDAFVKVIVDAIKQYAGNELNIESMQKLNAEQITLWGYTLLHEELMDGGFVQLIQNGYGPFFFDNPFAKAIRLWNLKDLSKLIYKAKEIYDANKAELTKPCNEDEFMAMFELFPQFDDLDDAFIENEEQYTNLVACYIDNHLDSFVTVEKQLK